jgi:hypothetical protein
MPILLRRSPAHGPSTHPAMVLRPANRVNQSSLRPVHHSRRPGARVAAEQDVCQAADPHGTRGLEQIAVVVEEPEVPAADFVELLRRSARSPSQAARRLPHATAPTSHVRNPTWERPEIVALTRSLRTRHLWGHMRAGTTETTYQRPSASLQLRHPHRRYAGLWIRLPRFRVRAPGAHHPCRSPHCEERPRCIEMARGPPGRTPVLCRVHISRARRGQPAGSGPYTVIRSS